MIVLKGDDKSSPAVVASGPFNCQRLVFNVVSLVNWSFSNTELAAARWFNAIMPLTAERIITLRNDLAGIAISP
jgi:hypothetical protein